MVYQRVDIAKETPTYTVQTDTHKLTIITEFNSYEIRAISPPRCIVGDCYVPVVTECFSRKEPMKKYYCCDKHLLNLVELVIKERIK